jgi:hypothetical protein
LGSQNLGGVSVFLKDLTTALNKSKLNTDEKEQIKNKAKQQCMLSSLILIG